MSEKKTSKLRTRSEGDLTVDNGDPQTQEQVESTRSSRLNVSVPPPTATASKSQPRSGQPAQKLPANSEGNKEVFLKVPSVDIPPGTSWADVRDDSNEELNEERRQTRSSPQASLPSDVQLKITTQYGRIDTLKNITELAHQATSLEMLDILKAQASEIHREFIKEHSYLESRCATSTLNQPYFKEGAHGQESRTHLNLRMTIARMETLIQPPPPTSQSTRQHNTVLPRVQIPTFAGEYTSWPNFKGLFSSLVLENEALSNIEKLHYLTNALKGPAADVIANLPMTDEAFGEAWKKLQLKYENKRKLVSVQLDKLFANTSTKATSPSAHLTDLITRVDNALSAIQLLGQSTENWDTIISHYVTKQLDDVTKERWESLLGDNANMPTYEQLKTFIATRIRTLENLEPAPASSRSSPQQKPKHQTKPTVGNVTTSTPRKYTCDCCGQSHFIVSCQQFRELSQQDRLKVIREKQLCFNCMGRHSSRSCRMTTTCSKCQYRHHTMLHDAISAERSEARKPEHQNSASTSQHQE